MELSARPFALLALFQLALPSAVAAAAQPKSLSEVLAEDAKLHDVTFIDSQRGWAVGDRGVVLCTDDGGVHWRRQPSGVDCPLLSVTFVSPERGWIAGGDATPLSHRSRGRLLRTIDGGRTWQRMQDSTLPRLTHVQFFDAAHGVATGYGSSFYPSGLFVTRDAGATWQPFSRPRRTAWLAADFLDLENGVLVSGQGERAVLIDRELQEPTLAGVDARRVRAMDMRDASVGWLVGDDGLIAVTNDGGVSWSAPAAAPLTANDSGFTKKQDYHAVCARGEQVWIAGSPGGTVWHSPDGGRSWVAQATGLLTPLNDIAFVDSTHGWAVGSLGVILATDDGGRNWRLQRSNSKRVAVLAMMATPQQTPVETLCRYGAGEGYRAVAVPLFDTLAEQADKFDTHRVHQALAECGAELRRPLWNAATPSAGHQSSSDTLLAELNRLSDGQAEERLIDQLVIAIRTWRPDVLLVPHERGQGSSAADALVEKLALEAMNRAADPTFDVALVAAGLPAWKVKRIVGSLEPGQRGNIRFATDDFVPALGGSSARYASKARNLLHASTYVAPPTTELELLWQTDGLPSSPRDLFAGLNLLTASDARRPVVATDPTSLDRLRRLTQKRRQLVRLLDHSEGSSAWMAQAVNLTGGLDPQSGGELLRQLAEGYRETGQTAMAADTLYLMARRYPDHPLTEQALVWLVRYYASGEVAHRAAVSQAKQARQQPLANVHFDQRTAGTASAAASSRGAALPDTPGDGAGSLTADERWERATALGKYLQTARPAVYAEPSLRFPLAVASRQLGFGATAERYFTVLGKSSVDSAWQRAARAERWLAEPTELPPEKPIATCRATNKPPHLDGLLNEQAWAKAEPLRLTYNVPGASAQTAGEADSQATVQLCRDADFLYVAIVCPQLADESYPQDDGPRTRDSDLSQFDRVQLSLDVDRDYGTAFSFNVDCRGWTHDACWGDVTWNPKWYVAQQTGENEAGAATWQVELAIPWEELSVPEPAILDTWAMSAMRRTARNGETSWTGYVDETPDAFGMLLFR